MERASEQQRIAAEQHAKEQHEQLAQERVRNVIGVVISIARNRGLSLFRSDSSSWGLKDRIEETDNIQDKEVFKKLLHYTWEYPEQMLLQLSALPEKENIREMVFNEVVNKIGQTDPDRGFSLLRDDLLQRAPDISADNLSYSDNCYHAQMACAASVGDLQRGMDYIETHLCTPETSQEKRLREYDRAFSKAKYIALDQGQLEQALLLHRKGYDLKGEREEGPSKELYFSFERQVAEAMLTVDIDRAKEIFYEALGRYYARPTDSIESDFALNVREVQVDNMIHEGQIANAFAEIQQMSTSEKAAEQNRAFRLRSRLEKEIVRIGEEFFVQENIEGLLRFSRNLPEELFRKDMLRRSILLHIFMEAEEQLHESGKKFSREAGEEKKIALGNEIKRLVLQTAPEFLLPGIEGKHIAREDRIWIDKFTIELGASDWTAIAMNLKDVPERQIEFASIPGDRLLFGHEHSKEERKMLIDTLFQAQRVHNVGNIASGLHLFSKHIEALDFQEQMKLIDEMIKVDPLRVFEGLVFLPTLMSSQEGKLITDLTARAQKDFYTKKDARALELILEDVDSFEYMSISKAHFFEQAVCNYSMAFYEYFLERIKSQGREEMLKLLPQATLDKICLYHMRRNSCDVAKIVEIQTVFGVEEIDTSILHESIGLGISIHVLGDDGEGLRNYVAEIPKIGEQAGVEIDLEQVVRETQKFPCDILTLLWKITVVPDLKPLFPWGDALERLEKIQARAANEENDPWKTDLVPLADRLVTEKVLSMASREDGELLVEFVKTYGMVNAPKLAYVFFGLKRAKTKEEIPKRIRDLLSGFIGTKQTERLERPADLLNELQRAKAELSHKLLKDDVVPGALETELGKEVFFSMIGSTNWEREDDLRDIARTARETRYSAGERGRVPEGYEEFEIQVWVLVNKKENEDKKERRMRQIKKVCSGKGFTQASQQFVDAFRFLNQEHQAEQFLEEDVRVLREHLTKKVERLSERLGVLREGKTRTQVSDAYDQAQKQLMVLNELRIENVNHGSMSDVGVCQEVMERLIEAGFSGQHTTTLLRHLSGIHMHEVAFRQFQQWAEEISIACEFTQSPSSLGGANQRLQIRTMRNVLESYINEHYLNNAQKEHHTGHEPFSDALLAALKVVWGFERGVQKNLIVSANEQINTIRQGGKLGDKKVSVSAVPGQGIMRVYSGDTGDACYTSRHGELARGKYPNLHAYTFVTGRNTHQERFVGSVLAIETRLAGEDTNSTLLVRANNPRENLIQNVEAEAFIKQELEQMIALAKRRGLDRVVVPLDRATASCSNRHAVANFYHKYFKENPRVKLTNEPETNFNGYNVWNPNGSHPCVVIWDKENGKIGAEGWVEEEKEKSA
jgi:hypothetical protein